MAMSLKRSCTSSSQEVVLRDEDLLTLILLRVPRTRHNLLKSVSKQWQCLITAPHFRNLLPPLRASGLFIQVPVEVSSGDNVYFVPLDDPRTAPLFRNLEKVCILQSCNGLLLCSDALRTHYVYDSSTDQLASLPRHGLDTGNGFRYVGLAYDPSKSLHYKVIAFVTRRRAQLFHHERDFYVYSSETKTWKSSVQSFISGPGMYFNDGVYWKGRMHWLSSLNYVSEPESALSECLYFNVDEERLGTFPRPPIRVWSNSRRSLYFGESEDHLHVVEARPYANSLSVYEMKSDYSEWFVKYRIDLDPISRDFPEIKEKDMFDEENDHEPVVNVLSLIRRENFHEDSFAVLEIPGKAIRYNLVDRSFQLIRDFGADLDFDPKINDYSLCDFTACQYIVNLNV
ncbi:F-box protein At5g07610 [Daucus carota subsp. sativus]|nr:PREDICTED: F-box protein At5g07610-like [Daucus carota subsp. sativus]